MSSTFETSTVAFYYPGARDPGLRLVGKRYMSPRKPEAGLSLVFTHCADEEFWEPAWSFNWRNHGESAVLNDTILKVLPTGLSVQEWATALQAFLKSDHLSGHDVVGVGHSSGATALMMSTTSSSDIQPPYKIIILAEPALLTRPVFDSHLTELRAGLSNTQKMIDGRRDAWDDRNEARGFFRKRLPWKIWDPRILELFFVHAISR
ncbi:hypothetical protein SCP_0104530 [Sparassis crispa]|uniref:AB hydrolase-1 domain-containing protein n=1 Tax=Sparassis crispa TaxID=139825 RepID=A0A401G5Z9_9APHY|nr:hypothetical protein SCP_0104530 [Sparassis crispa]GBE77574.1 hypothetical protein SCP_0104530 [Sparassis crispa]